MTHNGLMASILREKMESRELIEVYRSHHKSLVFDVGCVENFNDDLLLIQSISSEGALDGFIAYPLDVVARIGFDTDYLISRAKLLRASLAPAGFDPDLTLRGLLRLLMEIQELANVIDHNKNVTIANICEVGEDEFVLKEIGSSGETLGFECRPISEIHAVEFRSIELVHMQAVLESSQTALESTPFGEKSGFEIASGDLLKEVLGEAARSQSVVEWHVDGDFDRVRVRAVSEELCLVEDLSRTGEFRGFSVRTHEDLTAVGYESSVVAARASILAPPQAECPAPLPLEWPTLLAWLAETKTLTLVTWGDGEESTATIEEASETHVVIQCIHLVDMHRKKLVLPISSIQSINFGSKALDFSAKIIRGAGF